MTNYTDSELVRFWAEYVGDPATRIRNYGGFFERQLKALAVRSVLDLGAGLGIDSIHLASQGFEVSANEADPVFRSQLEEKIAHEGSKVMILPGHDWRTFPTDKHYDATVLIGNSFTYLREEEERREALRRFHAITDKVMIIDTRNYDFMHRHGQEIVGEKKFPFKKKFYYTSEHASSYLVSIDTDTVVFEVRCHNTNNKYQWHAYPLRLEELTSLVREAGFSHVETYGDFSLQWDPEHTDFFQVVAQK